MPELPEVETIVRDLNRKVVGLKITDAWTNWPRTIKTHSLDKFRREIKGLKIEPGFNTKVKRILSGKKGCVNVLGLLTVAAPLAINISWFINRKRMSISDGEYQRMKQKDMLDKCIAFSSENLDTSKLVLSTGEVAIERECSSIPPPPKRRK